MKIFLRADFFSRYTPFFISNPRLRFGCDFLPNPGNIISFARWNKQKGRVCLEMDFYGINLLTANVPII